ncbi:MAG: trigger factor [Gemmatimonadota bacterium]|nr:trigger factor [Gemmatimonadota bacterium]
MSQTRTGASERGRFDVALDSEKGYLRRLTITVDPGHVAATRRKEGAKLGKTVRLKGFRKGKVPLKVVEERYGPVIDERTLTTLVNEGFRAAVAEHDLETIGEPGVADVEYEPGEQLSFSVEVEVMPEIELGRTGGFRLEKPEIEVAEEEVDEILESLRSDHAVLEPVERAPEAGDVVSVLIRSSDDAPEESEVEERPYRFELGEGHAIPDVEEAILTLEPGQEGEFDVTYPDDFGSEALAGRTRRLTIRLVDVRSKRLPELDDDFALEVGDFDSFEALREAVREDVVAHKEHEAREALREALIDRIIEANAFEVPPSLTSRYLDRVIDAPDDAEPERVEEARKAVRPAVERQIKRDLVLERVIQDEGLEPSDEEVDARIAEIAEKQGSSPAEVRQRFAREKRLESLRHRLAVDKAFELLMERSEVS